MSNPPLALRYVGGAGFRVGVPTRDMPAEEVAAFPLPVAALLDAGYLVPEDLPAARALKLWPLRGRGLFVAKAGQGGQG